MNSWTWAAASCKGVSHSNSGTRKQDAQITKLFGPENQTIGCIVSDGAGSASFGGQGASIICRSFGRLITKHQETSTGIPTPEDALSWVDDTRSVILDCAERRDLIPRDFAATLVLAISDGANSLFVHIGDGGIVIRETETQSWICPTWPNQGEYASSTFFLTDDEPPPIRICMIEMPIDALAVFTDGIERLALDFSERQPHRPFFDAMIQPVTGADGFGRNKLLSSGLQRFLDSDRVNERTDDDKTLVLAARR